jgi:hypothetical protein
MGEISSKNKAQEFLRKLKSALDASLSSTSDVKKEIEAIVKDAKSGDHSKHHLRSRESAFVNTYVIPCLFGQLKLEAGCEAARRSLLSESWRNMKHFCEASPARSQRHPFGKEIGAKSSAIAKQWKGQAGETLIQPCPDFALREPFPKIVFEAKYFSKGDRGAAETVLVTSIYQAFFYRALPFVAARKSKPAWDYDYACLLAYDASEKGSLKSAWDSLNENCKKGFWEGANVFVMIV